MAWVGASSHAHLVKIGREQARYVLSIWAGITPYFHKELLSARMRGHLRRLALYAREHGKPAPAIDGILFPKATWKKHVEGIVLAKEVALWCQTKGLADGALRVRLP